MMLIRRRLFWKIYLTLLSSLVAVAVLMGSLWWMLGETPHERWGALRVRLAEAVSVERTAPPGALGDALQRAGDAIDADISLFDADGALIASRGAPITRSAQAPSESPQIFLRNELSDGRVALVRFRSPPSRGLQAILTAMLIVAGGVGLAAFPMTARLTRQLEALRTGMARWGEGETWKRLDEGGSDEVAMLAHTFNAATARIKALLSSQKALLANASHELRSPLARLRMAVDLWLARPDGATRDEIVRNLTELDQLVDEILLRSRLDHAGTAPERTESIDLLGLAAEEAARTFAHLDGANVQLDGSEKLMRRLIRNLLENGVQHGRAPVRIVIAASTSGGARLTVSDAGDGIPPDERERVFEPFYRPSGRSEAGGGWGLGLSLVRQIAACHGGRAFCEDDGAGGSRFVVDLPLATPGAPVRTAAYRRTASTR